MSHLLHGHFFYWLLFPMSIFLNVPIPQNPLSSHALLFNVPFSHGHPLQISLLSFLQSPISSMFAFCHGPSTQCIFSSMAISCNVPFLQCPISTMQFPQCPLSSMSPFFNVSYAPYSSSLMSLFKVLRWLYITSFC